MPKSYRRVENCGPVPYPNDPTKFLTDEVVTGDEWEPLVVLGFVEVVEGGAAPAPEPEPIIPDPPKVEPEPEPAQALAPEEPPKKRKKSVVEEAKEAAAKVEPKTVMEKAIAAAKSKKTSGEEVDELRTPDVGTGDQKVDPEEAG